MENFNQNTWLISIGVIAIVTELVLGVATGFDLLILGIIFIIAGVIGSIIGGFAPAIIILVLLVVGYIAFGRRVIKQKLSISTFATNTDALLGKKGIVTKRITAHTPGQIKVDGEIWRAEAKKAIDEGTTVEVESVSGVTLSVRD